MDLNKASSSSRKSRRRRVMVSHALKPPGSMTRIMRAAFMPLGAMTAWV
jgi:hypothetical protein